MSICELASRQRCNNDKRNLWQPGVKLYSILVLTRILKALYLKAINIIKYMDIMDVCILTIFIYVAERDSHDDHKISFHTVS